MVSTHLSVFFYCQFPRGKTHNGGSTTFCTEHTMSSTVFHSCIHHFFTDFREISDLSSRGYSFICGDFYLLTCFLQVFDETCQLVSKIDIDPPTFQTIDSLPIFAQQMKHRNSIVFESRQHIQTTFKPAQCQFNAKKIRYVVIF